MGSTSGYATEQRVDGGVDDHGSAARRRTVRGGGTCRGTSSGVGARPGSISRVPSSAAGPAPRMKLTRRGRVVLILVPVALALAGVATVLGAPLAQASAVPAAPARTVVVHTGDSLWSLAERLAPHRDPRDVVEALQQVNALPDGAVRAGQRLVVPAELTAR